MMVLLVGKKVKEVCNIIVSSSRHVYLWKKCCMKCGIWNQDMILALAGQASARITSSLDVYLCKPSLYNVHCFIGCWFWSYWWSSSHHSTDPDILWVRSGFESCGAQIQWATWGAWQFAHFCTWWKWWTQWCTGLLWKLHHIQEFWWSGWYSNAHPTQKGWQCTFLFYTCRGWHKIILHCNAALMQNCCSRLSLLEYISSLPTV